MKPITINKVIIAKGAIYDYEQIVCLRPFRSDYYKTFIEEHLSEDAEDDVRLTVCDPVCGMELVLFIQKLYDFDIMRTWSLKGICSLDAYDVKMEESGAIQKWLEVEIE